MIYADYNGSAVPCEQVKKYLCDRIENGYFANPNAIHSLGGKILHAMEKARKVCAKGLGAQKNQIIFNSGSSEGISHIFHSLLDKDGLANEKPVIVISNIEHSAVVQAAMYWQGKGFKVLKCPVTNDGVVNLDELKNILNENEGKVSLVSIMAANNETGVIQPYKEIGEICQKSSVPFFSDTTQYIGKMPFDFSSSNMDYAVLSGHKIGSIVGSGLILAKDPSSLSAFVFGGGQEKGLRGGTQNYIGNECIAVAVSTLQSYLGSLDEMAKNRDDFERKITEKYPNAIIFGRNVDRIPTTTLISLPGVHGQAVQIELESNDIFVTTSSACSDNDPGTSKVLKAMNVDDDAGRGVVRISPCPKNSKENYEKILSALDKAYEKLLKIKTY